MTMKQLPPPTKVVEERFDCYNVEVVIFRYEIPKGMSYDEGVEYNMVDERLLVGFDSLDEATAFAEQIVRRHSKYESELNALRG